MENVHKIEQLHRGNRCAARKTAGSIACRFHRKGECDELESTESGECEASQTRRHCLGESCCFIDDRVAGRLLVERAHSSVLFADRGRIRSRSVQPEWRTL